jgi:hypothetical protein
MNFSRDQYESAYMRAIAYFSLTVGAGTATQLALILIGSQPDAGAVAATIGLAVAFGILAVIIAAVVSSIDTLIFGVILTVIVFHLLRSSKDWRHHVVAYFVIGVIGALPPVVLYVALGASGEPLTSFLSDWLSNLNLCLILLAAGLSTALSWYYVWKHPKVAERAEVVEVERV